MKQYSIIVAGGSGSRMNSTIPKQFMLLNKQPVLMHTLKIFEQFDAAIEQILVLPENQFDLWEKLCVSYDFKLKYKLVAGGENRFSSVKNGLNAIENKEGIVFIHDGVRPLVSIDTLSRCLKSTVENGNAVPVMPVVETLRKVEGDDNIIVDRSQYFHIQTPQVFQLNEIKAAYQLGYDPSFTDDTSVLERLGKKINMVEGNPENIKITHPQDLIVAEALFTKQ